MKFCIAGSGKHTQFLVYTDNPLDKFAVNTFQKIIVPLRQRTGWTAQYISKLIVWITCGCIVLTAGFIDIKGSPSSHINTDIFIVFICLVWLGANKLEYKKFLRLSEIELHEIDIGLLEATVDHVKSRIRQVYINTAIMIFFAASAEFWWIIAIVLVMCSQFLKDTCLTAGGSQKKLAKEKKLSFSALLKLLPGSA